MKPNSKPHKDFNDDEEDDGPQTVKLFHAKSTPPDSKNRVTPGHVEKAGVTREKGNIRKKGQKLEAKPTLKKKLAKKSSTSQKDAVQSNKKRVKKERAKLAKVRAAVKSSNDGKDTPDMVGGSGGEDGQPEPAKDTYKIPTSKNWMKRILAMKQEPQIIEDLLPAEPGSYGIIAGRTGIGKTNLILHLGHCLATGSPFFGIRCEKVKVAILAFEGDPHNLSDRMDKIATNFPDTENLLRFSILQIQNPEKMLADVGKRLAHTPGVQMVILDPIKYLVPGDYLKPKDVKDFIQAFLEFLSDLKMSAVTTLPIKKPQDVKGLIRPSDIYSIKGATEWVDSATFGILVEKKAYRKHDDEITMSFAKHRIASHELEDLNLIFSRESCTYEILTSEHYIQTKESNLKSDA
ncbi:MAG: AAA family ATPase [Anaerolineales bacterium]